MWIVLYLFTYYIIGYVPTYIYNEIDCEVYGNDSICRNRYIIEGLSIGLLLFVFFKFMPYIYNIYIICAIYIFYIYTYDPYFRTDRVLIISIFFSLSILFGRKK